MSDNFGHNIKALRESLGITQRAFARQIHCDRSTVAKKESGARSIFLHELPVIMEALGIDDANLLIKPIQSIQETAKSHQTY